MIKAVLFDMDGILLDLCAIHRKAFRQAVAPYIALTEADERALEGIPTRQKLAQCGILHRGLASEVADAKQTLTLELIQQQVHLDAYKAGSLWRLRVIHGLKTGCYTNSIRLTAVTALSRAGLYPHLDEIITNQEVSEPKPSPAGYLQLMQTLDVEPHETLILEDSDVGFRAAHDSGAHVALTDFDNVNYSNITEWIAQCNS